MINTIEPFVTLTRSHACVSFEAYGVFEDLQRAGRRVSFDAELDQLIINPTLGLHPNMAHVIEGLERDLILLVREDTALPTVVH